MTDCAYLGVLISLASYCIGAKLKNKFRCSLFNPLVISGLLTIALLLLLKIPYESYRADAKWISYLLTPATVSLAVPLYEQVHVLKKNTLAILTSILAGVITSLVCVGLIALFFSLDRASLVTLLPKSITTAIGMPLSGQLGGNTSITVAAIIITGVVGNTFAEGFLKLIRVTHPVAKGLAIGTSAHAMGTARAMEMGEVEGAMSSLSIALAGLLTVLLIQFI
ncbi:MAG: LrgB family protein [Clostridiales bacterium]|nr:LrgB family protein [Bacillota bacterium]NLL55014.1 LrgB family protein [Clostridiales bacterium]